MFSSLLLSFRIPLTHGTTQSYLALVDTSHLNASLNLTSFNQTAQNLNIRLQSISSLQDNSLSQSRLLLIIAPQANYTASDISSLQAFLAGGGSIWIAGGGSHEASSLYINRLLNQLGSDMRLEQSYLEDILTNHNSTQQDGLEPILPTLNHSYDQPEARNITQDVRVLDAYEPVPILGWNGVAYTSAESLSQIESRWLAASSPSSQRAPTNSLPALFIGNQTQAEKIIIKENLGSGEIVAFGSPIFSDLMNMFPYAPQHPTDNSAFIVNLLKTQLKITSDYTPEPSINERTSPTSRKIVIDLSHSALHKNSTQYSPFQSLLDSYGFQTEISTTPITTALITDAAALIIVTPNTTLTTSELNATRDWFKQGHHFLWIASGADNPNGDTNASTNSNAILQTVNSTLRFELGTVSDGGVNLGGQPYLVLSAILNRGGGFAQNFTQNVRSLYFYSPTNIAGWSNGAVVRLESQLFNFPTVTWLAKSSNTSSVTTLDSKHKLLAYNGTAPTSLILSAAEKISTSTLLLTGSTLFLDYQQMFRYPTLYGYPQDNGIYARNVLLQTLQHYVNSTSLKTTLTRLSDVQGNPVTLHIQYQSNVLNLQTMNTSKLPPVPNPTLTTIIASATVTATRLANGTLTATALMNNSGSFSYSVTASSKGYANQSSNGNFDVKPSPQRFAIYVLTIPPLLFIAASIAYLSKKGRLR
jgi:hypothetical protein